MDILFWKVYHNIYLNKIITEKVWELHYENTDIKTLINIDCWRGFEYRLRNNKQILTHVTNVMDVELHDVDEVIEEYEITDNIVYICGFDKNIKFTEVLLKYIKLSEDVIFYLFTQGSATVKLLIENGYEPTDYIIQDIIRYNDLESIKYITEVGYIISEENLRFATIYMYNKILTYLKEIGY